MYFHFELLRVVHPFFFNVIVVPLGFPGGASGKEPPASAGDTRDLGSITGLGRPPWRRKWQPTPVFLPGESHGHRSLAGYSSKGHKSQTQLKVI